MLLRVHRYSAVQHYGKDKLLIETVHGRRVAGVAGDERGAGAGRARLDATSRGLAIPAPVNNNVH